ncbi:MAG TPA: formate dehydrogenase subunit delta [Methylophilaceae bacterium]|nr:formate dehydrogenase subunit delta [Methylophilaceae bacterium]
MSIERLITMANQIGEFFRANPDSAQAKEDIVNHLKKFWAYNMRQQILVHVQEKQGAGLEPIVGEAIREHQASLL